jgi:hypothetical protein
MGCGEITSWRNDGPNKSAGSPGWRARVADEFDPRAYFMSLPVEPPKPKEPEADFDAREYLLNGFGGE